MKLRQDEQSNSETRSTLTLFRERYTIWFVLMITIVVLLVNSAIVAAASEVCDNGRDDDGDFATDCSDLDCAGAAGCPCMDIQAVPVVKRTINKVLTTDFPETVTLRTNICQSAGCTFQDGFPNLATPGVLGDDRCMGPGRSCPTVTIDQRTTLSANTGRSNVCQSANCYFSDSGESDMPTVLYDYVGDLCSPYYQDGRRYRQSDGSTCQGIWSYLPEEDQSKPPPADSNGARRVGCCYPSLARCVNGLGTCFNFEEADSTAATLICGEGNNWDKCGAALKVNNVNTLPGTFSDGRNHICRFIEGLFYGWLVVPDEDCGNTIDDDFDNSFDCADTDCYGRAGPGGALCPIPETICMDGADNDGDGLADCKDSDCHNLLGFSTGTEDLLCEYGTETRCTDNYDNDWDGLVDCLDANCRSDPACFETLCKDGLDNNGNNLVDCADPGCSTDLACPICMEITLLPGGTGSVMATRESQRSAVCASMGCRLVPLDGDTTNDECRGIRSGCPTVALYSTAGLIYNDGRRNICTTVGCVFTEGAGVVYAGSGDLCTAAVIVVDGDGDGVSDSVDNCPSVSNPDQLDTDGDGMGDVCDDDDDGDRIRDANDVCPGTLRGAIIDAIGCSEDQRDDDGDGIPNGIDLDDDDDGVRDDIDACPGTPVGTVVGADGCPLEFIDVDLDLINDGDEYSTPSTSCVEAARTYPSGALFFTEEPFIGCRRGDMDDDGIINFNDYSPWLFDYRTRVAVSKGDVDGDDRVDFNDYSPWLYQYRLR